MKSFKCKKTILLLITAALLALCLCLTFTACDDKNNNVDSSQQEPLPQKPLIADTADAFEFADDGETVTGLKDKFREATSAVIPDGVKYIEDSAFCVCTNLMDITFPDSLEGMGISPFAYTAWYEAQPDGLLYLHNWLVGYKGDIPENWSVDVKDGTVGISDYIFNRCEKLISVSFPDSIRRLDDSIFEFCTNLKNVRLPEGLTRIGESTFWGCSSLKYIYIPDSVTEIARDAFNECSGLLNITLPEGITEIAPFTFYKCTSLTEVNLPHSLKIIDYFAFCECPSLKNIVIPEEVTHIKTQAFFGCDSLESLSLPDKLESIGNSAFTSCNNLTELNIPSSVTEIGTFAFSGTKIRFITIPESVKIMGEYVFTGCNELIKIDVMTSAVPNGWKDNWKYSCNAVVSFKGVPDDSDKLIFTKRYDGITVCGLKEGVENIVTLTIPEGVCGISARAFANNTSLESLTLPSTLCCIYSEAFKGCTNLTNITFNNQNPFCYDQFSGHFSNSIFSGCDNIKIATVPAEGLWFIPKTSLRFLTICGGEKVVGNGRFPELLEVVIEDGVTKLGFSCFEDCHKLTDVTIPESVSYIDDYAFESCYKLKNIKMPAHLDYLGRGVFWYCRSLEEIKIPDGITEIKAATLSDCTSLNKVVLPEGVARIEHNAFGGSTALSDINLSDNITYVGDGAFYDTAWLKAKPDGLVYIGKVAYQYKGTAGSTPDVVIKNGTVAISAYAFMRCDGLRSITIPASVTAIEQAAFIFCKNLESIVIQEGNSNYYTTSSCLIENESKTLIAAFGDCTIPNDENIKVIGTGALSAKKELEDMTIPDGVEYIKEDAFRECSKLKIVRLPASIILLDDFLFYDCNDVLKIYFNGTKEQWDAVYKQANFAGNLRSYSVHCTDGTIEKTLRN